jgi:hypothetical protein
MGEATKAPPINQRSRLRHILDNVNRVCHYHKLFTEQLRLSGLSARIARISQAPLM